MYSVRNPLWAPDSVHDKKGQWMYKHVTCTPVSTYMYMYVCLRVTLVTYFKHAASLIHVQNCPLPTPPPAQLC